MLVHSGKSTQWYIFKMRRADLWDWLLNESGERAEYLKDGFSLSLTDCWLCGDFSTEPSIILLIEDSWHLTKNRKGQSLATSKIKTAVLWVE